MRQIVIRVEADLAEEIEGFRVRLQEEAPGLSVTTSSALRVLIRKGLVAAEEEAQR